jgi:hypothetical protein
LAQESLVELRPKGCKRSDLRSMFVQTIARELSNAAAGWPPLAGKTKKLVDLAERYAEALRTPDEAQNRDSVVAMGAVAVR